MADDGVSRTINEMRVSPEQLQQYSDQVKNHIPELRDPNGPSEPVPNLSAEQQLELLQQIRASKEQNRLEYNPNFVQSEENYSNNDTILTSETQNASNALVHNNYFNNSKYNKFFNIIKVPLLVFCIIFIILLPGVQAFVHKILVSLLMLLNINGFNNNIVLNNIFKGLFGSVSFGVLHYLIFVKN